MTASVTAASTFTERTGALSAVGGWRKDVIEALRRVKLPIIRPNRFKRGRPAKPA